MLWEPRTKTDKGQDARVCSPDRFLVGFYLPAHNTRTRRARYTHNVLRANIIIIIIVIITITEYLPAAAVRPAVNILLFDRGTVRSARLRRWSLSGFNTRILMIITRRTRRSVGRFSLVYSFFPVVGERLVMLHFTCRYARP